MNLSRSLLTAAHTLHNLPAWPTVMMKDQGKWVEKPYCLYLFLKGLVTDFPSGRQINPP